MEFITLDAQDYETALSEARTTYGTSVRVHTRKDYLVKKGLKKERRCTISFYLVKEWAPETEETLERNIESIENRKTVEILEMQAMPILPDTQIEGAKHQQQLLTTLLEENDFADDYIQEALTKLLTDRQFETIEELEMALLEHIIESVVINHGQYTKPKQYFVLLGPTGVGKTTTLVKMAMFYMKSLYESPEEKVALLSLDSYRTGATGQIEQFSKDFGIDLFHAHSEEELSALLPILNSYALVLVDTMGKSANQGELSLHLKTLLTVLPQDTCSYALAVSASHKNRDLDRFVKQFSTYPLESLVITKLDETEDIGNVLSVSKKSNLPLLFFTNGQRVPDNLLKATNEVILSFLRGFTLDLQALTQNQNHSKNNKL